MDMDIAPTRFEEVEDPTALSEEEAIQVFLR